MWSSNVFQIGSSCSVDEAIREALSLFLNLPPSLLPFNPLTPAWNCLPPTPHSQAFFGISHSKRKHKNRSYAQYYTTDTRSDFKTSFIYSWMKGQNIIKYQQKELNLMCKTNIKEQKTNFFFAARQKPRKLNLQKWVYYCLQGTKQNQIKQNFLSFTITNNT